MKDQIIDDIFWEALLYHGLDKVISKLPNGDKAVQIERSMIKFVAQNPNKDIHIPHIKEKDIEGWIARRKTRFAGDQHKIKSKWKHKK
jgi:hypothetical protein